jgi:2-dehydropantoate 2-reductase
MGCLFAAGLQRTGATVTLVPRDGSAGSLTITLEQQGVTRQLSFDTSPAADTSPVTHLLVTTKAYDVVEAVSSLSHRLDTNSQVLLLANGMGFAEQLSDRFAWLLPYCGTTTEGAYRPSPGHVRHAGRGRTRIGRSGQAEAPDWLENWRQASGDCRWETRIELALWEKLAINCAINPLTALHDCRNGELYSRPELRRELDALCEEIARVSEAAGHPSVAADLHARAGEVIRDTANNHSSMLQDLRAGRRTEIDYITGHLLQTAASLGVDTPHNQALFEEIRQYGH